MYIFTLKKIKTYFEAMTSEPDQKTYNLHRVEIHCHYKKKIGTFITHFGAMMIAA